MKREPEANPSSTPSKKRGGGREGKGLRDGNLCRHTELFLPITSYAFLIRLEQRALQAAKKVSSLT